MSAQRRILVIVALFVAAVCAAEEDFYDVLELPEKEDASEKDIKKQFRVLSKKYHPDLNPSEEAKERYVKIQRAHEVLSDRRKRKMYDMRGEEGLQQLETQAQNPHQHHDPFARLFGMQQGSDTKGRDVELKIDVPLADVYNGATHQVTITKQKLCRKCKGSGAASKSDYIKCKECKGSGHVLQRIQLAPGFVQQVQQPCPSCQGKGKTVKNKCPTCKGNRVSRGDQTLEIPIEKGIPEEHRIVFEMEGDQNPEQIPGDVIFIVKTKPDSRFVRKGNDLETTVPISLKDALLGFTTTIFHLDGHGVSISNSGTTQFGDKKRIKGEGMPFHNVPSERGDLIVTFEVELPRRLSEPQEAAIRKAFVLPIDDDDL